MMQSETGQRYVSNQYDDDDDQEEEEEEEEAEDEEYVMEEDDDYYVQESSDDDEDGVEEQSNLSRFLQYVVQRATGGDGNNAIKAGNLPNVSGIQFCNLLKPRLKLVNDFKFSLNSGNLVK